ncbi:hypothetical protein [Streptomyces hebeiensis]
MDAPLAGMPADINAPLAAAGELQRDLQRELTYDGLRAAEAKGATGGHRPAVPADKTPACAPRTWRAAPSRTVGADRAVAPVPDAYAGPLAGSPVGDRRDRLKFPTGTRRVHLPEKCGDWRGDPLRQDSRHLPGRAPHRRRPPLVRPMIRTKPPGRSAGLAVAPHEKTHSTVGAERLRQTLSPQAEARSHLSRLLISGHRPLRRLFTDGGKAVASNGVLGNPRGMSSELGFACLNGVAIPLTTHATIRYRQLT